MEVEINCTRLADMDLSIALRSNWSYLSQRIWSGLGEGDAASGRFIIAEGHAFEKSTNPSKSYPNRRDVNWNLHKGIILRCDIENDQILRRISSVQDCRRTRRKDGSGGRGFVGH